MLLLFTCVPVRSDVELGYGPQTVYLMQMENLGPEKAD